MTIKIEIDDELADAICARFGYDQKTEEEKKSLSKEDFVTDKIIEYIKQEGGAHLIGEAQALAERTTRAMVEAKVVEKGK